MSNLLYDVQYTIIAIAEPHFQTHALFSEAFSVLRIVSSPDPSRKRTKERVQKGLVHGLGSTRNLGMQRAELKVLSGYNTE